MFLGLFIKYLSHDLIIDLKYKYGIKIMGGDARVWLVSILKYVCIILNSRDVPAKARFQRSCRGMDFGSKRLWHNVFAREPFVLSLVEV